MGFGKKNFCKNRGEKREGMTIYQSTEKLGTKFKHISVSKKMQLDMFRFFYKQSILKES